MTNNDDSRVLSGILVLDFGRVVAGPHTAQLMCDMGAEVLKIERPRYGDDTRMDPFIYEEGLSAAFMQQNWGKKSLSIDLRHEGSKPIIERLVQRADVIIENFRPGVMDKMGFGYERLREINPRIVLCSVSAYGQDGPYAKRSGYGPIAEAVAAIPELSGETDGPPMPTVVPIADNMASALALGAVCAALYSRERTGHGEHVDIALLDAAFQMHDMAIQQYLASGGEVQMTRRGLRDVTWVPWGFFEAADGWIVIMAGNESIWRILATTMGREDMLEDVRYADFEARSEHRDEVYGVVEAWVASFASAAEIVDRLAEVGVPCERVNDVAHAVEHPQIKARNMLVDMTHPRLGPMKVVNSGIKFAHSSADIHGLPPDLGEHNREILVDMLGYTPEDVDQLHEDGVLYVTDRVQAR
jgi:crotonobetainyl-CoA:carnitine CoA-transferase CaiB-like acyl-CoA transferase